MASVTLTITDSPTGVTIVVEADPAIPTVSEGVPDVEDSRFTDAMACGVYAARQIADSAGSSEWRGLVTGHYPPDEPAENDFAALEAAARAVVSADEGFRALALGRAIRELGELLNAR